MKKAQWLMLVVLFFHHTQAQSIIFDGLPQTLTNNEPIVISDGCAAHQITKFLGTEIENGEINIYVSVFFSMFTLSPCMPIYLEVGTFPSGSYTINYYTSERGRAFELHSFADIVIERASENEPASGRILISGDVIEDQIVTANKDNSC